MAGVACCQVPSDEILDYWCTDKPGSCMPAGMSEAKLTTYIVNASEVCGEIPKIDIERFLWATPPMKFRDRVGVSNSHCMFARFCRRVVQRAAEMTANTETKRQSNNARSGNRSIGARL